jgi:hypothetical protein
MISLVSIKDATIYDFMTLVGAKALLYKSINTNGLTC